MIEITKLVGAFEFLIGIAISIIGFFLKRVFTRIDSYEERIKDMETELLELKVKLVENHPNKEDFREFKQEIIQMLSPINSKLDSIENFLRTAVLKRKDD